MRGKDRAPRSSYTKGVKSTNTDGSMSKDYYRAYYQKNRKKILANNTKYRKEAIAKGWKNPRGPMFYRQMVVNVLIQRDGYVCGVCHAPLHEEDVVQIDHIVPWNISKDNSAENLQLAHKQCNINKKRK